MDLGGTSNGPGVTEIKSSVDYVNQETCKNSGILVNQPVSETVIVIISNEKDEACVGGEEEVVHPIVKSKMLEVEGVKDEKHSCVIDVKCGAVGGGGAGGEFEAGGERVCRICHLSSEQSLETAGSSNGSAVKEMNLIQLGCGCKDELGTAHSQCAEAWFKLKGNRMCEICGEPASNITGIREQRFMEEWNEGRSSVSGTTSAESSRRCWHGQPFCNFLMACLIVAFVLPWFFRVNLF